MRRLLRVGSTTLWAIAVAWVVPAEAVAAGGPGQSAEPDTSNRRCFIGSSLFMLANVVLDDPPSFYQLNIGYWLTRRDVISLEVITWRYTHPLGIPYGKSFGAEEEAYPGSVRGTGAGLAYQRYLWRVSIRPSTQRRCIRITRIPTRDPSSRDFSCLPPCGSGIMSSFSITACSSSRPSPSPTGRSIRMHRPRSGHWMTSGPRISSGNRGCMSE